MPVLRTRIAAASGAALVGAALVVAPGAIAPANAASKVPVRNAQDANKMRQHVINIAKSKVGHRYVWGAAGPSTFDCSGLVNYAYRKATGKNLPHSSYTLASSVTRVSAKNRKPGDLVFFHGNGHVAIYMGHNKIVHASNPRRGIRIDTLSGWYKNTIGGYGRVIEIRGS